MSCDASHRPADRIEHKRIKWWRTRERKAGRTDRREGKGRRNKHGSTGCRMGRVGGGTQDKESTEGASDVYFIGVADNPSLKVVPVLS